MTNITAFKFGYTTREIVYSRSCDFRKLVDSAIEQRPAALLAWNVQGPRLEILQANSHRYRIPLALLDIDAADAEFCVLTDDLSGIRLAVEHLYQLGHRRIVHVTTTLKAKYAKHRFNAYEQCLKEKGIVLEKSLCYHDHLATTPDKLIQYVQMLASLPEPPPAACRPQRPASGRPPAFHGPGSPSQPRRMLIASLPAGPGARCLADRPLFAAHPRLRQPSGSLLSGHAPDNRRNSAVSAKKIAENP